MRRRPAPRGIAVQLVLKAPRARGYPDRPLSKSPSDQDRELNERPSRNFHHLRASARGAEGQAEFGITSSFAAVEQNPPCRNKLEQDIVVADIRGQHDQAKPLRLQEQHTVLESAQLAVLLVSLEAA